MYYSSVLQIQTSNVTSIIVRQYSFASYSAKAVLEDTSANTSLNSDAQPSTIDVSDDVTPSSNSTTTEQQQRPALPSPPPLVCRPAHLIQPDETSSTSNDLPNPNELAVNSSSNSREPLTTTTEDDEDNSKLSGSGAAAACSYSDLLVKEVLAAKETLKKYLGNMSAVVAATDSAACNGTASRPRPDLGGLAKYGKTVCQSSNFRHR